MTTIGTEILETNVLYDKGDVVVFKRNETIQVGMIVDYSADVYAGYPAWYNISIQGGKIYSYSNGGDVTKFDIIGKITDNDILPKVTRIIKGEAE